MKQVKTIYLLTVAVMGVLIYSNASASDDAGIDLSRYLWKNRPLLLFAPSPDNPEFQSFSADLKARWAQIVDRDMVIIEVFKTGPARVNGKPAALDSAALLRQFFAVSPEKLTTILIGKDGGVKLKRVGRPELDEIFALIDSMPMRQREMRNRVE
jgi:hypothetical protein